MMAQDKCSGRQKTEARVVRHLSNCMEFGDRVEIRVMYAADPIGGDCVGTISSAVLRNQIIELLRKYADEFGE